MASARTPQQQQQQQRRQADADAYRRRLEDYELLLEYKQLQTQQVAGVYVSPSGRSLRVWHGVIFCRSGKYRNGVFKFRMDLSRYPARGPRVFFFTRVFNPLVHPKTGELDMSIQFPEWDRSIHFLALALAYLKNVFYNAHYWDTRARHEPFNLEAAGVWANNKARFDRMCEACVTDSAKTLYMNQRGSSVRFSPPEHNHSLVQHRVLTNTEERRDPAFSYLEWFRDGVNNLACNVERRLGPSAKAEEDMIREVEERRSAEPSPAARRGVRGAGGADAAAANEQEEQGETGAEVDAVAGELVLASPFPSPPPGVEMNLSDAFSAAAAGEEEEEGEEEGGEEEEEAMDAAAGAITAADEGAVPVSFDG